MLIFPLAHSPACQSVHLPGSPLGPAAMSGHQCLGLPTCPTALVGHGEPAYWPARPQWSHWNGLWEKFQVCDSSDIESLQNIFFTCLSSYFLFQSWGKKKKKIPKSSLGEELWRLFRSDHCAYQEAVVMNVVPPLEHLHLSNIPRFSSTFLYQAGIVKL